MNDKILKIKNIFLKYDKNYALKAIDISIYRGEIVALVGHNGSGKSSLINIIAGIQEPTIGTIELNYNFIKSKLFSAIGFSPQTQMLDWYTNVWDNVFLGTQLAGISSKEGKKLTEKALKLLKIFDLKNKPLDALSGGQQQRVQIARSIVHEPDLYLLDEPTTGLDAESANNLLSFLKKEASLGKTIFISSHDLNLLEEYCDKLILIDEGEILYYGNLKKFLIDNTPRESYKIITDKVLDEYLILKMKEISIYIIKLGNLQYKIILGENMDITQLVLCTMNYFKIKEIDKESLSLRDLYIHYRKREVKHGSCSI